MKFSVRSLPVRLSLYICSLLFLFGLIGMILIGYFWFRDLTFMLKDHSRKITDDVASTLDTIFVQAEQMGQILTKTIEQKNQNLDDYETMITQIAPVVNKRCPALNRFVIAWADGMLNPKEKHNCLLTWKKDGEFHICRSNDDKFDYFYKNWFIVPCTLEAPIWTTPYYPENGPKTFVFSYAAPFYRESGGVRKVAGVVAVDIEIESLEKYLEKYDVQALLRLSSSIEMFLMNQFGQIEIYPEDPGALGKTIFTLCDQSDLPDPADRKAAQSIFKNKTGKISMRNTPLLDVPCELYYSRCINDWFVCLAIPLDWTKTLLLPLVLRFMLGWFLALAATAVVIFLICRKLNKPLLALSKAAEAVGHGDFTATLPAYRGDDEIGHLTGSFGRMQKELSDYIIRLRETVAARERSEGELNAAKKIQQDLLPHHLPPYEDCENISAAADLIAARGVGGDLYDLFPMENGKIAIIIGDVSGKGVPAALFMAVTQTLQRVLAQSTQDPGYLVAHLNEMLSGNNETGMFVTYWLGILDTQTGHLIYSNAGHNPPLIRRANGKIDVLRDRHTAPLCVLPDESVGSSELQMKEDDLLILYTDGVSEAFSADDLMFGEDRILKLAASLDSSDPKNALAELKKTLFQFTQGAVQSDDITILCVKYAPVKK
ncbi:MAG: SpoIIE family protein phosphatase [Planctomycetia bacterium]|nr:SpoIIE family protein phosphatase [Planctomycetia bacterium]